jgi:hypothetical protein
MFGDWFALGSGCKAKFDLPESDVSVMFHGPSDGGDWVHHARFRLEKFELYANGQPTKLARECAIRLNLNPPPHARIVSVRAETSVESEKPKAADLVLFSELRIGNTPLARTSQHFDAKGPRRKTAESFDLSSGKDPAMPMPELGCGEPKILGFDFTWIADGTAAERPVHVTLGHDRTLSLEVRVAPCP